MLWRSHNYQLLKGTVRGGATNIMLMTSGIELSTEHSDKQYKVTVLLKWKTFHSHHEKKMLMIKETAIPNSTTRWTIYQLGFVLSRTCLIFSNETLVHTLPLSKTRRGFCNLALRQRWRERDTLNTILDRTNTYTHWLEGTTLSAQTLATFHRWRSCQQRLENNKN